jgi:hypothetical protein
MRDADAHRRAAEAKLRFAQEARLSASGKLMRRSGPQTEAPAYCLCLGPGGMDVMRRTYASTAYRCFQHGT